MARRAVQLPRPPHAPTDQVAVLAAGSVRPDPAGLERARDSFVLSAELAAAEAEALGAEVVEIGRSGHLVPVDQPGLFAEAALAFLA